jgi:hypothetical protein
LVERRKTFEFRRPPPGIFGRLPATGLIPAKGMGIRHGELGAEKCVTYRDMLNRH